MSHPRNKRERFIVGKRKGRKRANGMRNPLESWTSEWFINTSRALRDTTKICSCSMCRNPRHSLYSKGVTKLTMQERKANESNRNSMF